MPYVEGELGSRTVTSLDGVVHVATWTKSFVLQALCGVGPAELRTKNGYPVATDNGRIDCMACLAELTK